MYLKEWNPIFGSGRGAIFRNAVLLSFSAELECPACHEINRVKTSAHFVSDAKSLDSLLIERKVDELRQHRGCAKCGTVSTLPQVDLERLKQEVKSQITSERIRFESGRPLKQGIIA